MRFTPIRNISEDEKRELYELLDNNPDIKYRAKIILLAVDGYTVPEIREMTTIYDKTIRKWIHRFNDYGVKGIRSYLVNVSANYKNTFKHLFSHTSLSSDVVNKLECLCISLEIVFVDAHELCYP